MRSPGCAGTSPAAPPRRNALATAAAASRDGILCAEAGEGHHIPAGRHRAARWVNRKDQKAARTGVGVRCGSRAAVETACPPRTVCPQLRTRRCSAANWRRVPGAEALCGAQSYLRIVFPWALIRGAVVRPEVPKCQSIIAFGEWPSRPRGFPKLRCPASNCLRT